MLYLNLIYATMYLLLKTDLTLTNVVFEFNPIIFSNFYFCYLTLTNVVFELNGKSQKLGILCNLTLTNVVFECNVTFESCAYVAI